MNEPKWVSLRAVIAIHSSQIAEHGGLAGVRDAGLLESALSRPRNLFLYDGAPIERLAAAYAFGIASNHPFNDGNKRSAFLTMYVFLRLNGFLPTASETEVVQEFVLLAAGEIDEEQLEDWIRSHCRQS